VETDVDRFVLLPAWQGLACKVLETISAHATQWIGPLYESFRQGVTGLIEHLKNNPSSSSVIASATTASKLIEDYQRDTRQSIDRSIGELNDIIGILISFAADAQVEYPDSEAALSQIQERIQEAKSEEDLRLAKADLTSALNGLRAQTFALREQISTQRQITSNLVTDLRDRVHILEQSLNAGTARSTVASQNVSGRQRTLASPALKSSGERPPKLRSQPAKQIDTMTGLPNGDACREAIRNLPASRNGLYLAVFQLMRTEVLNARYGEEVGNAALLFCSQLIAIRVLRPTDQLYRWRGPSFCALLERDGSLPDVRRAIRKLIEPEVQFEWRDGLTMLYVGVSAEVIPVEEQSPEELIQELEQSILQQSDQALTRAPRERPRQS